MFEDMIAEQIDAKLKQRILYPFLTMIRFS